MMIRDTAVWRRIEHDAAAGQVAAPPVPETTGYQTTIRRAVGLQAVCLGMLLFSVPGFAETCPDWDTEEYFEAATPADVESCLRTGSDPNARDGREQTPLHRAARARASPEVVRMLAAAGADPNAVDGVGILPLSRAVSYAAGAEFISTLIAIGADPNARELYHDGGTALHVAAGLGSGSDSIRTLVAAGADLEMRDRSGMTPLHAAVTTERGRFPVAELIAIGANVNARGEGGWTPLHLAAEAAQDEVVVELLLDAGSDPFALAGEYPPLVWAVANHQDPKIVGKFVEEHLAYGKDTESFSPRLRQRGLHRAKCWFDPHASWPRKECYFMIVGEDPADPESNPIAFPVVKFVSQDRQSGRNPVLHLGGGGPGGAMSLHVDHAGVWSKYKHLVWRSGRDLYVMDPRGVGMSHPRLHCPNVVSETRWMWSTEMTAAEELQRWLKLYRECRAGLDWQDVDLSHYHSRSVAHDVEQLRRSLEVEKWVLYGISYGTRYALTIARHFPESVEAMILAAAAFPNLRSAELLPDMILTGLNKLFAWCGRAGTCDPVRARERLQGLVRSLDASPLVIDDWSGDLASSYGVEDLVLTGQRLLAIIFSAQYDADVFAKFPLLLDELTVRQTTTLEEVLWPWLAHYLDEEFSEPVFNAHFCAEEHPFTNYDAVAANVQMLDEFYNADAREAWVDGDAANCEIWDVRAEDPEEGDPVKTMVPTLFLQGALDPVTPVEYLGPQLKHFGHHEVLVFKKGSHGDLVEGSCALDVAGHFADHKALPEGFDVSQCDPG